jgi:hypothetical protein
MANSYYTIEAGKNVSHTFENDPTNLAFYLLGLLEGDGRPSNDALALANSVVNHLRSRGRYPDGRVTVLSDGREVRVYWSDTNPEDEG